MENLRLALFLVCIAIIAGIYLWDVLLQPGRSSESDDERSAPGGRKPPPAASEREALQAEEDPPLPAEPFPFRGDRDGLFGEDGQAEEAADAEEYAEVDEVDGDGDGLLDGDAAPPAAEVPADLVGAVGDAVPGDVEAAPVVLFVRAAAFQGEEVLRVAGEAGMRLGGRDIFHHAGESSSAEDDAQDQSSAPPSRAAQFSMADMYEPGAFPVRAMSDFQTDGLVLLLYPPNQSASEVVPGLIFDHFLSSAHFIAAELRGALCVDRDEPLNESHVAELRARYLRVAQECPSRCP